jgi:hypothetical protein
MFLIMIIAVTCGMLLVLFLDCRKKYTRIGYITEIVESDVKHITLAILT